MSNISEIERLYQQMGGNTPKEDLSHLKVYIQGDEERGNKIIDYLLSLDSRVVNTCEFSGYDIDYCYYIDINNNFKLYCDFPSDLPSDYEEVFIEDILDDEIEEENMDDNDEEEKEYCPMCEEEINTFNCTEYYSDGEECCDSCYDESLDDLNDDEEDMECNTQESISSIDIAESMLKQLSETKSEPKGIIDIKLSELSKLSRNRRK